MAGIELLDKIRRINSFLHSNNTGRIVFTDICTCIGEMIDSGVLVFSRKGKVLGKDDEGRDSRRGAAPRLLNLKVGSFLEPKMNERLLTVLSTKEDVNLETIGFSVKQAGDYRAMIMPIIIGGERLGTLFVYRKGLQYTIDDIILNEYGATVVGLEMLRSVKEEDAEENRKEQEARAAVSSLSASEARVVMQILKNLPDEGGLIVASRLADEYNITRSVVVNAIKKLESAGIISVRSAGMKGTYLKILNEDIRFCYEALENKGGS